MTSTLDKLINIKQKTIIFYSLNSHSMKIPILILILLFLLPLTYAATNCSTASQAQCGTAGSTCKYFIWSNTSCIAPTDCSAVATFTVWSNASNNCIPCEEADSSMCTIDCAKWKYYYDTTDSICTTCAVQYGSLCLTCNSNQCLSCITGYTLSGDKQSCFNGQCNINYCITCASSTACGQCDPSYKLFSGSCVCSISNCEICGSGTCQSCFTGYALTPSKTKCKLICIPNCDVCTDLLSCTTCLNGYYYEAASNQCKVNCTIIDPNCVQCSTTAVCNSCGADYTLDASGIVCNPKCSDINCVTCSPSINNCSLCATGYKVVPSNTSSNYVCSSDICQIDSCISCASATTCAKCADFYALSSDGSQCDPNCGDTNCIFCSSLSACKVCADGFKVSSSYKCVKSCSISNCDLCHSQTTCLICKDGYIVSGDGQSCNFDCGILDCINCNSTTTCSQCYTGYVLEDGGKSCIVNCQDGYYYNAADGACVNCPATNCFTCDSIGKCLSCISLYYLGTDFDCKPCTSIANCFDCSPNGQCTKCNRGYYVNNGACVSQSLCTVSNCDACVAGTFSKCQVCSVGYSPSTSRSSCDAITCSRGQFLVGSTCTCGPKSYFAGGQCTTCPDSNCLVCPSASVCTSCVVGYYPSGSTCTACTPNCKACDTTGCSTCNDGFTKKSGLCIAPTSTQVACVSRTGDTLNCATGCKVCDLDKDNNVICRQASDGYVLNGGNIYKCPPSCLTCGELIDSTTGIPKYCLTCRNGYNFVDGECLKCTGANAITCKSSNTAYSLSCLPGYKADGGICKQCSSNCKRCGSTGPGSCDTGGCEDGYFQSKNYFACVKCFNGCLVCPSNPNKCIKCSNYQYLSNNKCYPCGSNCITCNSTTACTTCVDGYMPINGICKAPNIDNCVEYDSNLNCTKCDYNFLLTNGYCQLQMTCNVTKKCISCKFNYYLKSGQCFNCPNITNCRSCDVINSAKCMSCVKSYYIDNGVCKACPQVGCAACTSNTTCTQASDGYFLIYDITNTPTGDIYPCAGLCSTCVRTNLSCTACQDGATLTGTQCISNNYLAISFVGALLSLNSTVNTTADAEDGLAFNALAKFLTQMASGLGWNLAKFLENTMISKFSSGSVKLEMNMNAGKSPKDPNTVLANTAFSDIAVISVAVVSFNNAFTSNVSLALVLGISIPLGILLIAIIVIFKVKSKSTDEDSGVDDTQKDIDYHAAQF